MLGNSQSEPDKRFNKSTVSQGRINILLMCLFAVVVIVISPFFEHQTQNIEAVSIQPSFYFENDYNPPLLSCFQENTLQPVSETFFKEPEKLPEPGPTRFWIIVTGYSSTPCQTDDTPYITAAGTSVRTGIVAANFLPFGTKIKMPEIYGNKIFVVEDRMHPRNSNHVDVWFPTDWQALNLGARRTYIEIVEG
jgi:3D (Asp-Asp-Asp) domain-containing protein